MKYIEEPSEDYSINIYNACHTVSSVIIFSFLNDDVVILFILVFYAYKFMHNGISRIVLTF